MLVGLGYVARPALHVTGGYARERAKTSPVRRPVPYGCVDSKSAGRLGSVAVSVYFGFLLPLPPVFLVAEAR